MLVTTSVKPEWIDKIPAVTHVDNSVRHQSVTPESNLKFYNIINKFYEKTGVPVFRPGARGRGWQRGDRAGDSGFRG